MNTLDDGRIIFGRKREPGLTTTDPVCGKEVEIVNAAASVDFEGRTFYFCSLQCKTDFDRQPETYAHRDR